MVKIDAHHHLWKYSPVTHGWINDEMRVLKRDFLPEELQQELISKSYQGSVAVQASQSEDETKFLLEQAAQYPFIKGVVGWLDLQHPAIEEKLEHFTRFDLLKGLRHVVQDEPDDNFLLGKDFVYGISVLSKYNLAYDILIFPKHLKVAYEFVSRFPSQKFVLDHIAKPDIKNKALSPWKEDIKRLALHKNVYCKLSGMVTEANWQYWEKEDFIPYLDVVFEAFGPDRLMIGSDWPVCTLAGGYGEVMGIVETYLNPMDEMTRNKVLGENAIGFYNL